MKKYLAALGITATLMFGVVGPVGADTTEQAQAESNDSDDGDQGLWGLAGLLGLVGLAGLTRRRDIRHDAYTTDTVGTTTGSVRR